MIYTAQAMNTPETLVQMNFVGSIDFVYIPADLVYMSALLKQLCKNLTALSIVAQSCAAVVCIVTDVENLDLNAELLTFASCCIVPRSCNIFTAAINKTSSLLILW